MTARLYHYYDNQWNNGSKCFYSLNTHIHNYKEDSLPQIHIWETDVTSPLLSDKVVITWDSQTASSGIYIFLISDFWPSRCGRSLPFHAHQPRQPPLPCAHADPWPGERRQSLALSQEPRPWGPERGRAWQQDGVWDLPDEATSNKGEIYQSYCTDNMLDWDLFID